MSLEEKLNLIRRNTVEIITESELRELLKKGGYGYIGFEPSGLVHIGWIIWARKLQDLIDAGVDMIVLAATWHAWINDKLGGDIKLIREASQFVKHFLKALGVKIKDVNFIDAEELVSDSNYWALVLKVAKKLTLARVKRATTIMGRKSSEAELDFSKLIYPCMQVADIFYLKVDIALGGTDQRRAHVLAREIAKPLGFKKPIAIHTPLLIGLGGVKRMEAGEEEMLIEYKMSKSKPETCIFVHDTPNDIRRKIRMAYCPPRQIKYNPIIEINKLILFSKEDFVLHVEREEKYGGPLDIESFSQLVELYKAGKLHPLDLKNATAEALIKELEPIRKYLNENEEAKRILKSLIDVVFKRKLKLR